ncbi:hypothetical protein HDV06_000751 [Boothiomyces sp. JEL0866]|nr:hypothetical protein HDV06_000751 [Boothiomyces sp. JEL0866]
MHELNLLMKDQIELLKLEYSDELHTYYAEYLPSQYLQKNDFDTILKELNQHKKPRIKHRYIAIPLIIFPIVWTIIVVALFSDNLRWMIIIGWLLIVVYWMTISILDSVRLEKITVSCANLTSNLSSKGLVVQMQDSAVCIYHVPALVDQNITIAVNSDLPSYKE